MIEIPFDQINRKGYSEEALKDINILQDRAIYLQEQSDFRMHPVTLRLAKDALDEIDRIENLLKNDETLGDIERKALFRERYAHKMYFDLFTFDPNDELEILRNQVEDEINNNK